MKRIWLSLTLLLFVLLPSAGAQTYSITDLGPMVKPAAINNLGQVVGTYNAHGFIWTESSGLQDLGTLNGGTFSQANGINDHGVVTGTTDGPGIVVSSFPDIPNAECSNLVQPFIWTRKDGMNGLGTVPFAGGSYAPFWCLIPFYGMAINNKGAVVGYNNASGATYQDGFLETRKIEMSLIIGNWPPSYANGINRTGEVAGQIGYLGLFSKGNAISWNKGKITYLPTLGGMDTEKQFNSSANGINDLGQIVGFSSITGGPLSSYGPVHAVLWSRKGAISDLGTLPGDSFSVASKISFFGQVIGSSGNVLTAQYRGEPGGAIGVVGRPFIWTARSGMRDLNTLINANSGWVLNSATDINIWGQIIGSGTWNGETHGYLLTPRVLFQF